MSTHRFYAPLPLASMPPGGPVDARRNLTRAGSNGGTHVPLSQRLWFRTHTS